MTMKLKSNLYTGPLHIFPNFWHCITMKKNEATFIYFMEPYQFNSYHIIYTDTQRNKVK